MGFLDLRRAELSPLDSTPSFHQAGIQTSFIQRSTATGFDQISKGWYFGVQGQTESGTAVKPTWTAVFDTHTFCFSNILIS
ncbi:hypothetical protein LXL04_026427 [Taraxacum kok-saghyz]